MKCTGMGSPCEREGKRRRQNTRYVDDERNWVVMCDECFDENERYWRDMWSDYYAGCM